ncbi:MAG: hypothetical protein FJ284_02520 [Planctomycetes bacterium]|nr:hypothetical protein [Planctomycetota bacterium]
MSHRNFLAVASLALSCVLAASAIAGGSGGSGGGSKGGVPVRMKNVGSGSVAVNAVSGAASTSTLIAGARIISSNNVTQFVVRAGSFTALAARPSNPSAVNKVQSFSTRSFKTVYLYAQQDTTRATLTGAPGGVKF